MDDFHGKPYNTRYAKRPYTRQDKWRNKPFRENGAPVQKENESNGKSLNPKPKDPQNAINQKRNSKFTGSTGPAGPAGPVGPTGPRGPMGPRGKDGAGIRILDAYSTMRELSEAHPEGQLGDGYLVDGSLFIWNPTAGKWKDVGLIRGPAGFDGIPGPPGPKGDSSDERSVAGIRLHQSKAINNANTFNAPKSSGVPNPVCVTFCEEECVPFTAGNGIELDPKQGVFTVREAGLYELSYSMTLQLPLDQWFAITICFGANGYESAENRQTLEIRTDNITRYPVSSHSIGCFSAGDKVQLWLDRYSGDQQKIQTMELWMRKL